MLWFVYLGLYEEKNIDFFLLPLLFFFRTKKNWRNHTLFWRNLNDLNAKMVNSLHKGLAHFYCRKPLWELSEINSFKGLKDTVVIRALLSMHEVRDGRVRVFSFLRPISFFNRSTQIHFFPSQKYCLFSIYFVFLVNFSKIVHSVRSFVQKNRFFKSYFSKKSFIWSVLRNTSGVIWRSKHLPHRVPPPWSRILRPLNHEHETSRDQS